MFLRFKFKECSPKKKMNKEWTKERELKKKRGRKRKWKKVEKQKSLDLALNLYCINSIQIRFYFILHNFVQWSTVASVYHTSPVFKRPKVVQLLNSPKFEWSPNTTLKKSSIQIIIWAPNYSSTRPLMEWSDQSHDRCHLNIWLVKVHYIFRYFWYSGARYSDQNPQRYL